MRNVFSRITNRICFLQHQKGPVPLKPTGTTSAEEIRPYVYCKPQSKTLIKRKYRYEHPVHGNITVTIREKEANKETFQLMIQQHKSPEKMKYYKQNLTIRDYDEENNGRSTIRFDEPVLTDSMKEQGIHHLLNLAAADALKILGAGELITDDIRINNSAIDISELNRDCRKNMQHHGWMDANFRQETRFESLPSTGKSTPSRQSSIRASLKKALNW